MAVGQAVRLDAPVAQMSAGTDRRRYLYGPVIDFICMGGSTLFLLPLLFLTPPQAYTGSIALAVVIGNQIINQPHFAHSYQIFYRGFWAKIVGPGYSPSLRFRYIFAGIVVPVVMALILVGAAVAGSTRILGLTASAMYFFVGWHYVKQGYGILMVDAALKRLFFTDLEKRVLRANGYLVWIYSWLVMNWTFTEAKAWGLSYYALPVPYWLLKGTFYVGLATTGATLWMLAHRWSANGRRLPYNGVVGYVASSYIWLLFARDNILVFMVVPALHCLQYLVVVWRFETNYEKEHDRDRGEPWAILKGLPFVRT